jgi:hypothetical protein
MIQKVTQEVVDCDPAGVGSVPVSDTESDRGRGRQ